MLIVLSLLLINCSRDSSETEVIGKTLSISTSETLEWQLAKGIPIEGGFAIIEQAEYSSLSEIQNRADGIYYIYTPEAGFKGTDEVKIKRADSNGARVYSETIIVLTIHVTD